MADANTSTIQQAQDAQTLDNLTSLQQSGGAGESLATPDATIHNESGTSHTSAQSPDGPSLYDNTPIEPLLPASASGYVPDSSSENLNAEAIGINRTSGFETSGEIVVSALIGGANSIGPSESANAENKSML